MSKNKNNLGRNGDIVHPSDNSEVLLQRQELLMEAHTGPIPSANELKKYEEILPGAADRILTMAEKQAMHRQKLETAVVSSNVENSKRGQYFAFVISVAVIVIGSILIMLDKSGWGLSMILGDLAVLAAVFVGNRISEFHELSRKRRGSESSGDES